MDPHEFAPMLGAEIVGEVPDVGGGPFGMARLARLMHQRLTPSRGECPAGSDNPVLNKPEAGPPLRTKRKSQADGVRPKKGNRARRRTGG